ncbi:MAG: YcaO-like family protein, partial [archaeon]
MTVGIAGTGPAVDAIVAALGDVDVEVERQQALDVGAFELAIVVDVAGAAGFDRANGLALDSGTPWIAVELGGVGGVPVVDAAISGFDSSTGCYDCLKARVRSNVDPSESPTEAQPPATARFAGAIAGRAAASRLEDATAGPDVFGHVIELPYDQRQFLPVPHCPCENESDQSIGREEIHRSVEDSLSIAEQGLDERVGIVKEVGEVESYPLPYYMARTADASGFSDGALPTRAAAGVALDWNDALMKAFGEAYERYAASIYRTSSLLEATANVLDTAVPPKAFVGSESIDNHTRLWIEGENLDSGQTVQLPASLVVYPPPEERIRPANTTGLGLGNDVVEALLSGLYEVIERDASMLSWYSTFDPLGLVVEDEDFETLTARLGAEGLDVTTLLLTQDVDVPVVACAVHRDGEWPRFALGSGARLNPVEAAR